MESRQGEFHNGTHTLTFAPRIYGGGRHNGGERVMIDAHCARCATGFSMHDSVNSVVESHARYVGTSEQAAARRDQRIQSQQTLRDRYGDNVIGPDAVRGAMTDRPYSAQR